MFFMFVCYCVFETVFLCVVLASRTHAVDKAGLELRELTASASWLLRLKVWTTTAYLFVFWTQGLLCSLGWSSTCYVDQASLKNSERTGCHWVLKHGLYRSGYLTESQVVTPCVVQPGMVLLPWFRHVERSWSSCKVYPAQHFSSLLRCTAPL